MNQKIREIMKQPINKDWKKEIREICTYYGDEGTNGYSLSNGQFERVFEVISTLLKQQKQELREKIEKMKVGSWKEWIKATKKYGGSKEEWEKLQDSKTQDEIIDDILKLF